MASTKTLIQTDPIELPFVPPLVFNQQVEKKPHHNVETISSIEKAHTLSSSPYIPSKPSLEKPEKKYPETKNSSSTMDFLEKILALEDLEKKLEVRRNENIQRRFNELEKLVQEEAACIKQMLAHERNVTFWSILEDIGNIFVSSVSTVLGFSMVSSGSTVLGATLISSGILAITNITCKQTGTWDWIARQIFPEDENLRNQFALAIPAALGILTTILGISGSIGAYYYKQLGDFQRVMAILQTASSIVTGVTSIGNNLAASKAISSGAKLSFLQSIGHLSKIDLQNALQNLTTFFDNQVEIKELAGRIIEATQTQIQITQQAV